MRTGMTSGPASGLRIRPRRPGPKHREEEEEEEEEEEAYAC